MDKEKYVKAIHGKYGTEKTRDILNKLLELEETGGQKYYDKGIQALDKRLPKAEYDLPASQNGISKKDLDKATKALSKVKASAEDVQLDNSFKKLLKSKPMKEMYKKRLHSIPVIGGLAGALLSGDANAAIPILNEADTLGPQEGDEGYEIENPTPGKDRFRRLKEKIRK